MGVVREAPVPPDVTQSDGAAEATPAPRTHQLERRNCTDTPFVAVFLAHYTMYILSSVLLHQSYECMNVFGLARRASS